MHLRLTTQVVLALARRSLLDIAALGKLLWRWRPRIRHLWRSVVATASCVAVTSLDPGVIQGQRQIGIVDGRHCTGCRIVLDSIVTLTDNDTVSFSWSTSVIALGDHYLVGPTYSRGQVAVFNSRGNLARTFGRVGSGPGEFQSRFYMLAPGPGDSLHVLDQNRWMVFSPVRYEFVRFVRINAEPRSITIVDSGPHKGDGLVTQPLRDATGRHFTVHLISAQTGNLIRSFDSPPPDQLRTPEDESRSVTWSEGRVWSLPLSRIRIRSESVNGDSINVWLRTDGWFPGSSQASSREPFIDRPTPKAFKVHPEADILWIYATVADDDWKPLGTSWSDPAIRNWHTVDMNTVFDGVIEVIDRRTGAVITRLRTDYLFAPVPGNPSLTLRKTMREDGTIAMHLFRISLQR